MIVRLVVVGRVRGVLAAGVEEYEARARRYWRLEVEEVEAGAKGRSDPESVKKAEGVRILARIPAGARVVPLTREGKLMGSRELSALLEGEALQSTPAVVFVIGGAFGLDDAVLARAPVHLALSRMTFPHELARLVLAEQLYRAGTILRGEPYHKGQDRTP